MNEPSLQQRYDSLLEHTRILHGNLAELQRMLEKEKKLSAELRDYKWMYEELQ